MEDIISKIKATEISAKMIIAEAEKTGEKLISDAILEKNKIFDEKKSEFISNNKRIKSEKILIAEKEKKIRIDNELSLFKESLGDIESKKDRAIDYLIKSINNFVGL